jgi:hypothetical protein
VPTFTHVPIPDDLVGCTYDGIDVWASDGNARVWRITDLTTYVDYALPTGSVGTSQMACDGVNLWITGANGVWQVPIADPATATWIAVPGFGEFSGITYDPVSTNLWLSGDSIAVLSTSGALVHTITTTYLTACIIAAGGSIWAIENTSGDLLQIDPTTYALTTAADVYVPQCGGGITTDDVDLWATGNTGQLQQIPLTSPASLVVYTPAGFDGEQAIAYDGTSLWVGDTHNELFWQFDPTSPDTPASFAANIGDTLQGTPGPLGSVWFTDSTGGIWTDLAASLFSQVFVV